MPAYAGIQFRTELQARWAVLLDYNPLITEWHYRPRRFRASFQPSRKEWDFTPDFLFRFGEEWEGFLYCLYHPPGKLLLDFLGVFNFPLPLYFACGDTYGGDIPQFIGRYDSEGRCGIVQIDAFRDMPFSLSLGEAVQYDFSGPDKRPSFRTGDARRLKGHIESWRKKVQQ